ALLGLGKPQSARAAAGEERSQNSSDQDEQRPSGGQYEHETIERYRSAVSERLTQIYDAVQRSVACEYGGRQHRKLRDSPAPANQPCRRPQQRRQPDLAQRDRQDESQQCGGDV